MFDERKEAERAVVCPLQNDGLRAARTIGIPCSGQGPAVS
jgi:hypothetical protein